MELAQIHPKKLRHPYQLLGFSRARFRSIARVGNITFLGLLAKPQN
jgi:hypothetical protein